MWQINAENAQGSPFEKNASSQKDFSCFCHFLCPGESGRACAHTINGSSAKFLTVRRLYEKQALNQDFIWRGNAAALPVQLSAAPPENAARRPQYHSFRYAFSRFFLPCPTMMQTIVPTNDAANTAPPDSSSVVPNVMSLLLLVIRMICV